MMSLDECFFFVFIAVCRTAGTFFFVRVNEWSLKILTHKHEKNVMASNNDNTFRQMAICHNAHQCHCNQIENSKMTCILISWISIIKTEFSKSEGNTKHKIDTVRDELFDNHLDSNLFLICIELDGIREKKRSRIETERKKKHECFSI